MKELLENIYSLLFHKFGHRNWWPAETSEEIIIGAILTQNVSWANVKKAISNLKANNLLTLKSLHETDISEIAPLIRPTRFFNQKAQKLKNFTAFLFDKYNGRLDTMFLEDVEKLRKELLAIKGLGEETVDSILLYAGNKPIFVIDEYTKRIFSRLGITDYNWPYGKYQKFFMKYLDPKVELYNDCHAQIVHMGYMYCKKNDPECEKCPIESLCKYQRNGYKVSSS